MGKPTGFLEYKRQLPEKETATERISHYREFERLYSEKELHQQSARCMNCGVPFCHNGCPLGNFIPQFNHAVYQQQWQQAYNILKSTNNFPEFTGRLCPAPCESACVLGINQPPVTIEEIEKHVIELAFEKGLVKPQIPAIRTGKKIAVIGSGPAGLAAAAQLNYAGHWVTVFERDDKPGGLLRYGIPDFKLEKNIIERRIAVLETEGIQFKCGVNVGGQTSINDLLREYQAIVLATGSTVPRDLAIAGREHSGVYFAMQYLKQQNKRIAAIPFTETEINAEGKNVVVIGGGDTGSDCVGTAHRQKAKSVTQFELLPQPPAHRTAQMPWPNYPMLLKTTSSHEEGGSRQWAIATKAFIADNNGHLKALQVIDVAWSTNEDHSLKNFTEIAGTEREIPCELTLLAMGFLHTEPKGVVSELDLELDARGNVLTKTNTYQTSISKVFSCGDMHRGQSLIVWAISEGRECARNVDEFLMGTSMLETKDNSLFHG